MSKPSVSILHYTAPPVVGGVEATIRDHARLLARRNYPVEIVAGRGRAWHRKLEMRLIPEADSMHPDVVRVRQALEQGVMPPAFHDLRDTLCARLRRVLEGKEICFVHNVLCLHFNLPLTAAIHDLIDEGWPTRFVAWNHDFSWTDPAQRSKMHSGFPWDLLRRPREELTYVVDSEDRHQELAGLLGVNAQLIHVIPPGVSLAAFFRLTSATRDLIEELFLLDAELLLLLPARITRLKNVEMAIEVICALLERGVNAWLIVTGPPDPHSATELAYVDELREMCRENDVEDEVVFMYEHGPDSSTPLLLSDEVVNDLYQIADALFFPSRSEGFGIPMLEAGLARLPVFCSDIPPFHESAGEHAHFFKLDAHPSAIADLIMDVMRQDAIYALRQRVMERYAWRTIMSELIEPLIDELTENLNGKGR